jgi:hypothetical protein
MAQTFLVFDFGTNEEAAQQARHKFEGWKQAFRLGDKVVLKFERTAEEADGAEEDAGGRKSAGAKHGASAKSKSSGKNAKKKSPEAEEDGEKGAEKGADESSNVRILIRLSFSEHEKLSQQRWLDRIPSEEPFKSAKGETIRHSDPSFEKTTELFDSLDRSARQGTPR